MKSSAAHQELAREAESMRTATDILPIELWALVIHELKLIPRTAERIRRTEAERLRTLRAFASVCRALNDLCITRYLNGAGVATEALATGNIEINVRHLAAVQLACCAPPIRRLVLNGFIGLRVLKTIRSIVQNAAQLEDLTIELGQDVFVVSGFVQDFRGAVLTVLCDVMHILASRISGPVFVLSNGTISWCEPGDILQWQLLDVAPTGNARGARRTPGYCILRDIAGKQIKTPDVITSLFTLSVRCIASISRTLVVINPCSARDLEGMATLRLGRSSMTDAEISTVLTHIRLPELHTLHLATAHISSPALDQFLRQHPALVHLTYDPPTADAASPILDVPATHPGLTSIVTTHPAQLTPLLDALGTSPSLTSLTLPYAHRNPALSAALHRLALHPRPTHLTLLLASPGKRLPTAEDAALALTCVTQVTIECPTLGAAHALFPWLAALPALQRVEFACASAAGTAPARWVRSRRATEGKRARFLADAEMALPRVEEVIYREPPAGT
ncbi:hypothetical protein B0H15DRAFT_842137 [Mycena belliarum]|uniref:Uncharacterized protein n=1 Tax=Mycena belliarum TaxID=1033014 RepID=A0AAD6U7A7_9AGAR|nr:hypothetical protein B0H15DRAFT_842137 [Mycena belliae]